MNDLTPTKLRSRSGAPFIPDAATIQRNSKHEGVLVNTYRVPLDRFGDERPKLTFIPAEED